MREGRLVGPRVALVRVDGRGHVRGVLALVVAGRRVVAYGVQVEFRRLTIDGHLGSTVDGDAADVGGLLPENLCKVAPLVEGGHVGVGIESAVDVSLSLVPGLGDTGSGVVGITRDGEKVLALAIGDVVSKVTVGSGSAGSSCAVVAPLEVGSTVVGTGAVVVPENGVLVVDTGGKVGLAIARLVVHAKNGAGRGSGSLGGRGVGSRGLG